MLFYMYLGGSMFYDRIAVPKESRNTEQGAYCNHVGGILVA
jgi:hypothetical protein